MPTYQYACKECGHQFEAVQSFSDPSLSDCPECTGPLRKLFGSVGVIFKGSGFYRTDSRSGSSSTVSAGGSSSTSSSGSESKSSASTSSAGSSSSSGGSSSSTAAAKAS